MRRLIALLALLAGPAAAQTPDQPPPPAPMPPPGPRVLYVCPGGTDFAAFFSDDYELATLKVTGQPDIELPRAPSGSGFAYTDSYYELRGRGREATLTAAGRTMRCHAAGRPGEPPRTFAGGDLTLTLFPDGTFRLRDTRDGTAADARLDLGQWAQEVEGGVRLVLRGGITPRRAFREVGVGKLVAENGTELVRQDTPDPIEGTFRLSGLYRDAQDGGLFTECFTGRTYGVAPGGAEPEVEKAWSETTPSREATLFVEVMARFGGRGTVEIDRLVGTKAQGSCSPPAPRGAALRGTEWRLLEIGDEKPTFEDWRRRPRLSLDDDGKFAGSTGCNTLGGTYELDPEGVRFVSGAMTLMACPPPADKIERSFLDALAAVRTADIMGTTLDLFDATGKRRLRFEARGR